MKIQRLEALTLSLLLVAGAASAAQPTGVAPKARVADAPVTTPAPSASTAAPATGAAPAATTTDTATRGAAPTSMKHHAGMTHAGAKHASGKHAERSKHHGGAQAKVAAPRTEVSATTRQARIDEALAKFRQKS